MPPVRSMLVLPDATDHSSLRRQLDRAWERFLRDGDLTGVRPGSRARGRARATSIASTRPCAALRSMRARRCRSSATGQDAARARAPDPRAGLRAARRGGLRARVLRRGRRLMSIGGDPGTIAQVAEINLCPGARWREDLTGTNGWAALAERRATRCSRRSTSWRPVAAWPAPARAHPPAWLGRDRRDRPDHRALGHARASGARRGAALAAAVEERIRARQQVRDESSATHARGAHRGRGDDRRGRARSASCRRATPRGAGSRSTEASCPARCATGSSRRCTGPRRRATRLSRWPGRDERRRVACAVVLHERRAAGAILHVPSPPSRGARVRGSGSPRATRSSRSSAIGAG